MKLNFHQKILAYACLHNVNDALITYKTGPDQARAFERILNSEAEFRLLVQQFRKDPKNTIAILRNNMLSIVKDTNLKMPEKAERLQNYLPDYFDFMCLLDHQAFPSTGNKIYRFVPPYIPDNFSDMGSDDKIDENLRTGREKIHVVKSNIFAQSRKLFFDVYSKGVLDKTSIVMEVAHWVYKAMPYDHKTEGSGLGSGTIPIDRLVKEARAPLSVCRHHALYTQVLLQAFGLTSRLLKCYMDNGPHACNLVRINNKWFLLDVTNPILRNKQVMVCLIPIVETDIDLNKHSYQWRVQHDRGISVYQSRSNMFFRIK